MLVAFIPESELRNRFGQHLLVEHFDDADVLIDDCLLDHRLACEPITPSMARRYRQMVEIHRLRLRISV